MGLVGIDGTAADVSRGSVPRVTLERVPETQRNTESCNDPTND